VKRVEMERRKLVMKIDKPLEKNKQNNRKISTKQFLGQFLYLKTSQNAIMLRLELDNDFAFRDKKLRKFSKLTFRNKIVETISKQLTAKLIEEAEVFRNKYNGNDDDNTELI
jgi:hypothetical protein